MEASKNALNPVKRFWLLLKPDRQEIRNVYLYAIFNGLVNLSLPIGIQSIINLIQGGQLNTSWVLLVSFVILGLFINGVLQINQIRITENLQQKIFTRASFEFAFKVPSAKLEGLMKRYAPELMNRFFDVISIQKGLSKILLDFITAIIQVAFGLLLLSLYHSFFIGFSLILLIIIYLSFSLTASAGLRTSIEESKFKYKVVYWLQELARNHFSFRKGGKTSLHLDVTDELTSGYLSSRELHFKVLLKQYWLLIAVKVLLVGGLLVIGSLLVMDGQMNIGQFVASEIVILLILASSEKIILSLETIYDVLTSLEKIGEVTDLEIIEEDEECAGLKVKAIDVLELREVELQESSMDQPPLNLVINKGDHLFIQDCEERLRNELFCVLTGLSEPHKGSVLYNQLAAQELNKSGVDLKIGSCFHQDGVFTGSLFENITLGRNDVSLADVKEAASKAGLSAFVKDLPEGFKTIIGPQQRELSDKIMRRIILARAMSTKPDFLILTDIFQVFKSKEKQELLSSIMDEKNTWGVVLISDDGELKPYFEHSFQVKEQQTLIEKI